MSKIESGTYGDLATFFWGKDQPSEGIVFRNGDYSDYQECLNVTNHPNQDQNGLQSRNQLNFQLQPTAEPLLLEMQDLIPPLNYIEEQPQYIPRQNTLQRLESVFDESQAATNDSSQIFIEEEGRTLNQNQEPQIRVVCKKLEEEKSIEYLNNHNIDQAIKIDMMRRKSLKIENFPLTQTERQNIERIAAILNLTSTQNNHLILDERDIVLELIKKLYKMGVYWVEMDIRKQNDLKTIIKELNVKNKLQWAVVIEKNYFAWKASQKQIYKQLTKKEEQRIKQITDQNEAKVKITIDLEKVQVQAIKILRQKFKDANTICSKGQKFAKSCNRNLADTMTVIIIERIHIVYIGGQGFSPKKMEKLFKKKYPKLHKQIESFKGVRISKKTGKTSRYFQINTLKKILGISNILEEKWDEILNEVEIYNAIKKAKMSNKPFLKMYYYCFVPRLRQIHHVKQTRKNPWKYVGKVDKKDDAEYTKMKQHEQCSLQTALMYQKIWDEGEQVYKTLEEDNDLMRRLSMKEVESEEDYSESESQQYQQ